MAKYNEERFKGLGFKGLGEGVNSTIKLVNGGGGAARNCILDMWLHGGCIVVHSGSMFFAMERKEPPNRNTKHRSKSLQYRSLIKLGFQPIYTKF